ncbi:unnamed protein product [Heterobilharzia americana]|nr:unnamed protein product [Heterobilharzia americana]
MGINNSENKDLLKRIKEWNSTRLDLFKISEPNKRNEFSGVVRFFFRGDDGKYQSKCLRITNTATARHLVNVLVEKFHPDLRMLTAGRYAIYEYHTNTGERRLGADEAPLLVQLDWTTENQEGRFILRDESKPQTIQRLDTAYQNGSLTSGFKQRSNSKSMLNVENPDEENKQNRGFVRRWSSGSRKKRRKSSKHRSGDLDDELEQIPDTTFTRTLSNPDEVLRRRRQQRVHNRNQAMETGDGDKRGSLVKIYGNALNPTIPYILLPLCSNDTAEQIVQWTLEKYNLMNHVNPSDYCLVMVNLPSRSSDGAGVTERLPHGIDKEITMHDKDCVLKFREMIRSNFGVSNVVQIRHRYLVGKDGKRPPLPPPAYPHAPVQEAPVSLQLNTSSGNTKGGRQFRRESQPISDMPYLVEVINESDHSVHPRGLTIDLTDLFMRTYTLPIKLGTMESMVGPYPNIVVDKNEHPDIRPVHCTFCVVITTSPTLPTTNSSNHTSTLPKWKLPKAGSTSDLENFTKFSLLLTPSLDGFAKPPGPALIRVNGTRVTGPILVSSDAIIQLGKSLCLKYIQPIQIKSNQFTNSNNGSSSINNNNMLITNENTMQNTPHTLTGLSSSHHHHQQLNTLTNRLSEKQILSTNDRNAASRLKKDSNSTVAPLSKSQSSKVIQSNLTSSTRRQDSNNHAANVTSKSSYKSNSYSDQLPLSIDLENTSEVASDTLMDQFIHLLDRVLQCAQSDLTGSEHRESQQKDATLKTRSFNLAPAYSMYLTYRACVRKLNASKQFQPAERDHYISHLTNYMATRIYESVPNFNRNSNTDPSLIRPLTYWLGNSSELLHFFKNDIDLCSNRRQKSDQKDAISQSDASLQPSIICRDALHILAETVDHCFYYLRSVMNSILQPWLTCLTYPGDLDLQDDILLDDKPLDPTESWNKHKEPISMQIILQYFTYLMQQLRKSRVNAALTFQLYSQLFHFIGAHIFNTVLIDTEAKPRNVLSEGNLWLTRLGASRLTRRLDRIKRWAHKQGLELAVECRLQRCTQACQLIMANRTNLDEFYQHCISLISLNSLQLEWLLAHLSDPPPVPDDWIDLIVTGAKEVNDRAYADEMEHYINTGQSDLTVSELQLNELKELPIPLLLPADGYASDAVLTGIPDGLLDFLRPLIKDGLIKVKKHSITNGQLDNRPWTNCMRLAMYEKENDDRNQHNEAKSTTLSRSNRGRPSPTTTDKHDQLKQENRQGERQHFNESNDNETNSTSSLTSSIDSSGSNFKEFSTQTVRYQPNKTGTLQKSFNSLLANKETRTHLSLPDLSHVSFEQLAKEANVPMKSITQFFLKKYNNSLGLSIVAAKAEGQRLYGIYVKEIVPNGAADRDGRLKTGDQILAIGNTSLIGCAQSDAVAKISKQSRPDDGVQLIIARKAAQYHKIIELIRPATTAATTTTATTVSSINNHAGIVNHDNRRLQSAEMHLTTENQHRVRDKPHFNRSQPDLRTENLQNIPVDNSHSRNRDRKSNDSNPPQRHHHKQQQNEQQSQHTNYTSKPENGYTARNYHHYTVNKSRQSDQKKQQIGGSLSRSTPSLNLAEVGINEEVVEQDKNESYTDENRRTSHRVKRSSRNRTYLPGKIDRPQSVGPRSTSEVDRQRIHSQSTPSSPSSLVTTTSSSESDIVVNEPDDDNEQYRSNSRLQNHHHHRNFQSTHKQQELNQGTSRTETSAESLRQHKNKKLSSSPSLPTHHIHAKFQSQPNISKNIDDIIENANNNNNNNNNSDNKNSPVNSDAAYPSYRHHEKPLPMVESVSNEFTSLESVSSQQTVCSLNESQPITDNYNHRMRANSHETRRVRHQPPPPPPPQTSQPSNAPLNHAAKNEILLTTKDSRSEKVTWRETDLDHCEIQKSVGNGIAAAATDDDVEEWSQHKCTINGKAKSSVKIQEAEEISRNNSPKSLKSDNLTSDRSSDDRLPHYSHPIENASLFRGNEKVTEEIPKSASATTGLHNDQRVQSDQSVSHPIVSSSGNYQQGNSTSKSLMHEDEPASEALKPPSHAVVSINRWTEESNVTINGPVHFTDLPNVHIDPQRGRISTKSYPNNNTNKTPNDLHEHVSHKLTNNYSNDIILPSKSLVHGRISQFTSEYEEFNLPKTSTTTRQKSVYLSSSSYQNGTSGTKMYPENKGVNEAFPRTNHASNPRLNQEMHNPHAYSRPLNTPSFVPSPPPVPTAEYPQYHPPERLEPVHWSSYKHCSSSDEQNKNDQTTCPYSSVSNVSPKPPSSVTFQPSTINSSLKLLEQTTNKPDSENSYQSSPSLYSSKPTVHTSSSPTSSAANRVIALQSEIADLEARQRVDNRLDLGPTLDRLRVELQFQKRLAERESNYRTILNTSSSYNTPGMVNEMKTYSLPDKSNTLESVHSRPSSVSVTSQPYQHDWIHKRNQAEEELLERQNQRISQLEQEHKAMLIRQELRAKERNQWFEHKQQQQQQQPSAHSPSNSLSQHINNGGDDDNEIKSWNYQTLSQVPLRQSSDDNLSQASSGLNRYGRPRFDEKQEMHKIPPYSLQHPIQSRLGPQVVEGELSRLHVSGPGSSIDGSIRVKKSVSFDKNLETISVYSPPTTPQDSLIEHSSGSRLHIPNRTVHNPGMKTSPNPPAPPTTSYKKALSPPIGFEIDDNRTNVLDKHNQSNRISSNNSVPRSSSQGKIPTSNMPNNKIR